MKVACARRYVYNKIDVCSIEEVDAIARLPNSLPCSASQSLNMDGLLERMWDMMALVRAYTKRVTPGMHARKGDTLSCHNLVVRAYTKRVTPGMHACMHVKQTPAVPQESSICAKQPHACLLHGVPVLPPH